MLRAAPTREMCHAWSNHLSARVDDRGGVCSEGLGPLANGRGAPGRASPPHLAGQPRGTATAIAAPLGGYARTVRCHIRRFNAEGLSIPEDHARSARPTTYSADDAAAVLAMSLTNPQRLNLPFALWTLDRLAA